MGRFLWKTVLAIFGNPQSIIFAGVVLVPVVLGLIWKWNAWIDSKEDAAVAAVLYEQEKQTSAAIANELHLRMSAAESDQKTMLNLNRQKEASDAVAEQAKLELREYEENESEANCGKWSTTPIPLFPRRVLLEYLRQVQDPSRLYGGCAGTAAGCAAARLRDALDGTIDNRVRVPGQKSNQYKDD